MFITVVGVVELAMQGEVDAGTVSLSNFVVTPAGLIAWAGRPLKYQTLIGDAAATQIDVTHNLGTKDVHAIVRRVSDDKEVIAEITYLSTTVVRCNFATAPALNALRVIVLG